MHLKKAAHLSSIQWSLRIKDTLGSIQVVCPLNRDCPLLRFQLHYIDRGLKFGDLVVSIVNTVSLIRSVR